MAQLTLLHCDKVIQTSRDKAESGLHSALGMIKEKEPAEAIYLAEKAIERLKDWVEAERVKQVILRELIPLDTHPLTREEKERE
jgi:hypothetical protein